ncbi:hypothetical protein GGI42DRAFT_329382, partial [Trichoderma sp. SZMC 28013]
MFPFLAPSRWQLCDQLSLACEQCHTGRIYPGRLCAFGRPFFITIRRSWVSRSIRPNQEQNQNMLKHPGTHPTHFVKVNQQAETARNHKPNQTDAMTPRSHI